MDPVLIKGLSDLVLAEVKKSPEWNALTALIAKMLDSDPLTSEGRQFLSRHQDLDKSEH